MMLPPCFWALAGPAAKATPNTVVRKICANLRELIAAVMSSPPRLVRPVFRIVGDFRSCWPESQAPARPEVGADEKPQRSARRPCRQRRCAIGIFPEKSAISSSERPPSLRNTTVCSPRVASAFRGNIGSGHPERQVQDLERASAIPDLGQCASMGDLRIAQCLGNRAIGRTGNAMIIQLSEAFFGRKRARPRFNSVHQVRPVVAAIGIFRKARIGDPFGMIDDLIRL